MHDGSLDTLDAVLDHYERGGTPDDPLQDPRIRPITIDALQRRALIAFLAALSSPAAASVGREEPGR
jgi:cytochrome c peroxidase